jgi:steroid 5-alpha reductase family enzyme
LYSPFHILFLSSLQAQGLCQFQEFEPDYIYSLPFISGLVLFALGVAINQKSDSTLRSLRRVPGEYKIPRGGMFEYVSGAHYFGELLEWLGFALAVNTFSMQGVAFFVYTASNLIPRAVSHHVWYRTQFKDAYPNERKAVIPFLW